MTLVKSIYFIDFIFNVENNIHSLPQFHGARWNGFFHNLCNYLKINIEEAILGILPFRCGRKFIKTGELIKVRLLSTEYFIENLSMLINKYDSIRFDGDCTPQNHKIYKLIDGFANNSKIATITNDIDEQYNTDYHLDALDFF